MREAALTFLPDCSPIMKGPRTPGAVGEMHAATRLQTILPARPGSHAGAGREVRLGGSAHARFRISCHRRERAARLSAGVDRARRADRPLHVSGGAALHADPGFGRKGGGGTEWARS